ncbi:ComF family protein [Bittarella massiliensis (ex Durand et al. 2017)]|uniref:ComF family protein n=1 Tax=Bittarella massiliensis (ex Durand et al. 2017) TaxID=1720313 RepID=UPI001AA16ADF|nr:phosphoribosyltransferase family protein [Bittarella massiliensis (ex Durand et al. 2017)]MBO1679464.1 ComF family protein [Bittarella massiliensis (ex Durand et al. 2017)]
MRALSAALRLLYPRVCPFCGDAIPLGQRVCPKCTLQSHRISDTINHKGVLEAQGETLPYTEGAIAPFWYEGPVRRAITAYKFSARLGAAEVLAAHMADTCRAVLPLEEIEGVVCVPGRPRQRRERGFGHSELLAQHLARELGLPFFKGALVKLFDTPYQHRMGLPARRENLLGAFEVADRAAVRGKTLLLCDDIVTTGGTAAECAKMLRVRGCERVYFCAAAAAGKERNREANGKL